MSVTAVEALRRQTGLDIDIPEPGAETLELERFLLDVVRHTNIKDFNVAESITDGTITRTMDGASTLTVTIHDPNRKLLLSPIWNYTLDVNVQGQFFRLAQCRKNGRDLELTFEDRLVAYLRLHKKPLKVSRGKFTRAEFIRRMCMEVKATDFRFYCPELHKNQTIAKGKKSETKREQNREPGIRDSNNLTVKGHGAQKSQLDTGEKILDQGYHMGMNRKILTAGIAVPILESALDEKAVSKGNQGPVKYYGAFQQTKTAGWPASRDATKDSEAFFKKAKKVDEDHPNYTVAELATAVQNPQVDPSNSKYSRDIHSHVEEAKEWVKEYGAHGGDTSRQYYKQFNFMRGEPDGPKGENTWQAATRLAQDVRWRFFVVANTIYYISDDDLIRSKPRMTISEDTKGVDMIDFDWDTGKRVNEATVTCRADSWVASAGSVVVLEKCGPANGRWLVWSIERKIRSTTATITLHQPEDPKKEPAPELTSVSSSDDDGSIFQDGKIQGGSIRDKIVKAAQKALDEKSHYLYSQTRPMPKSLYGRPKGGYPIKIDCSAFATLCYKAAGAEDPNGLGYNGSGYTGSMMPRGHRTHRPKPGDLVFYSSPEHVGIYIGDGQAISFGSDPIKQHSVHYRNDFIGYFTYHLGTQHYPANQWHPPMKAPGQHGWHPPQSAPNRNHGHG